MESTNWRDQAVPATDESLQRSAKRRSFVESEREQTGSGISRFARGVGLGIATDIAAPAARVLGYPEFAADAHLLDEANQQVQSERDAQNYIPDFVERGSRSVARSLPQIATMGRMAGFPAIAGGVGVQTFESSYSEAIDKGATPGQAKSFAAEQTQIEVGTTLALQQVAPGLEGYFSKTIGKESAQAATNGFRNGLLRFAKETGAEIPEENIIAIAQQVSSQKFDMSEPLSAEEWAKLIGETTFTTGLTMAAANAPRAVTSVAKRLGGNNTPPADVPLDSGFVAPDAGPTQTVPPNAPIDPTQPPGSRYDGMSFEDFRQAYLDSLNELPLYDDGSEVRRRDIETLIEMDAANPEWVARIKAGVQSGDLTPPTAAAQPGPTPPPAAAPTAPPAENFALDDAVYSIFEDDRPKTQGQLFAALEEAGFQDSDELRAQLETIFEQRGIVADEGGMLFRDDQNLAPDTEQGDEAIRQQLLDNGVSPDKVDSLDSEGLATLLAVLDSQNVTPTQTDTTVSTKGGDLSEEGNQKGRKGRQGLLEETPTQSAEGGSKPTANDDPSKMRDVVAPPVETGATEQTEPPKVTSPAPVASGDKNLTDAIGDVPTGDLPAPEIIESTEPKTTPDNPLDQAGAGEPEVAEPKSIDELESLPRFSIYKRKINGQPRYQVRGDGKRGGGDSIHDSLEEAREFADIDRRQYEDRVKREAENQTKKDNDAKADADDVASYQGFDADSPMRLGRSRKSLETKVRNNGKVLSRKQLVEEKVADGWIVEDTTEQVPISDAKLEELKRERLEENRLRGRSVRYDELTAIMDRGYEEKNVKRLVSPDGSFLESNAVSATGMRYAEHLIGLNPPVDESDPNTKYRKGVDLFANWWENDSRTRDAANKVGLTDKRVFTTTQEKQDEINDAWNDMPKLESMVRTRLEELGLDQDGSPKKTKPVGKPKEETAETTLPKGWERSDVEFLRNRIEAGEKIFIFGGDEFGLQSPQQAMSGSDHLGMGYFRKTTPQYDVTWEAGGASLRTPGGKSYTRISEKRGSFPYDKTATLAALDKAIGPVPDANAPAISPEMAALADSILDELLPSSAPAKPKKRLGGNQNEPGPLVVKDLSTGEKTIIPEPRQQTAIEQAAEKAKAKGKASRQALMDALRAESKGETLGSLPNPKLMGLSIQAALDTLNEGALTFAVYAETMIREFPDNIKELTPYIEAGWDALYRRGGITTDPAGKVSDYLPKDTDNPVATKIDYGTPESPNRVELGKYFAKRFSDKASYRSILDARREAALLVGGKIESGTRAAKDIDEAVEQGVVRAARLLVKEGRDSGESKGRIYDRLVDLYDRQPNLSVRTSTSRADQAYSTPAPLAYAASVMADVKATDTAFDSSAGNGMLLIASDNGYANELNPDRKLSLDSQGLQFVWNQDATELTVSRQFNRITINPPFSTLNDENGKEKSWKVGNVRTNKIDHAITLKTLESMAPDGKAFILIGGKGFEKREPKSDSERGRAYLGDKKFYDTLYNDYNVVDHFTIHGNMYTKQGASFPVDVIIIAGKGASSRPKPYNITGGGIPAVIRNWEDLKDAKLRTIDGVSRPSEQRPNDADTASVEEPDEAAVTPDAGGIPTEPTGGRVGSKDGGNPELDGLGQSDGQLGIGNEVDATGTLADTDNDDQPGIDDSGQRDTDRSDRPDRVDRVTLKPDETAETAFQVSYSPGSKIKSVDTLIPRNHVAAVAKSLENVADKYGDLDTFVAKELGYSRDELENAFSAEQVDAMALAIARHKAGEAFIIGDQTGVGKGRAAAGMMIYAKMQGLVPVFITEKPTLYADMVRDLIDIGQRTQSKPFKILITNNLSGNDVVPLPDGEELKQTPEAAKSNLKEVVSNVIGNRGLINGSDKPTGIGKRKKARESVTYDAVFTTYNQMQPVKGTTPERADLLKSISDKSFFILDESHNAGGGADSDPAANEGRREEGKNAVITRAEIVRGIIATGAGVYFSSATYAKRAQVMDLYARTGMTIATGGDGAKLAEAIGKGGVPLQQVVSEMLVESGMYLRRERSFDGVEFNPKTVDVDLGNMDRVSGIFNAINDFDAFAQVAIDALRDAITSQGGSVRDTEATGRAGIESTSFSSILHNLVDQMLLSVKADAIADETIASIQRGESPVIYVDITLESALARQVDQLGAKVGDVIDFSYRDLVRRYLERSREYSVRTEHESTISVERIRLTDNELKPEGVAAYERCAAMINKFDANLPASPIDWIRKRIADAGYSLAEITGRKIILEYGNDGDVRLGKRPDDEAGSGGRTMTVAKFNDSSVDAVLINQSGSTGISMHASEKFANQKRRHMIIGQPAKNIDTFMQSLGRIHRTGQVILPRFTLLMTNAPAENRPSGVLVKKLSSLNANVTASAKGAVSFDVPDVMNVLGDQVVAEYLSENMELDANLGGLVQLKKDGSPKKNHGIAKKASGQMARRPVAEQQQFWESVVESYEELAEELNRIGKNPLLAATLDMQAKTLESVTIFEGDTSSANAFSQPAMVETVRALKPGKPMTADEVKGKVDAFYGEPPTKQIIDKWISETTDLLKQQYKEYEAEQIAKVEPAQRPAKKTLLRLTGQQQYTKIYDRLKRYAPGTSVTVYDMNNDGTVSEVTPGFVIGVKNRTGGKNSNPLAPSRWSAEIAIASPDRVTRMAFSRLGEMGHDGSEDGASRYIPSNSDLMTDKTLREFAENDGSPTETRFVGTGNILAAYSQLGSSGGQVVFFTDGDGNSRRGVLLPRNFKVDQWQKDKPVRFEKAEDIIRFMDEGGRINTPDGQLELITLRGNLVLRAPSSKQKGGKYTLNQSILKASKPEEFVNKGARSEMIVTDKKSQLDVVNAILGFSGLQANTDKDQAKKIIADNDGISNFSPRRLGGNRASNLAVLSQPDALGQANETPGSPVTGPNDDVAGIAAGDVVKSLSRIFDNPIFVGRTFGRGAIGQYMSLSKVNNAPRATRLLETAATSIAVATHETAHHIDRVHAVVTSKPEMKPASETMKASKLAIAELKSLDYEPGRENQRVAQAEGFAEFIRIYLTEPNTKDAAGNFVSGVYHRAPTFAAWFDKVYLPTNPALSKQLAEASKYITAFRDQSLMQKMRQMIGVVPSRDLSAVARFKQNFKDRLMTLKTTLIDKSAILDTVDNLAEQMQWTGEKLKNVYLTHLYAAQGHATRSLEFGMADSGTNKIFGKPFWERMNKLLKTDQEMKDVQVFGLARHTLWQAARGRADYNTSMSPEEAKRLLDHIQATDPNQYDRFEKASKLLSNTYHELLEMRVRAGSLSPELYDRITTEYGDNYFPLARVKSGKRGITSGTSYGAFINQKSGLRRRSRRGSSRAVIDVFSQLQQQAVDHYTIAGNARVMAHLRNMADPEFGGAEGMGKFMVRIKPRKELTRMRLVAALDQIVNSGLVEREEAQAALTAGIILGKIDGDVSPADLQAFADRHGIDVNDGGEMTAAAMTEPDISFDLQVWNNNFSPEPGKSIGVQWDDNGNELMYQYDEELYSFAANLDDRHLRLSTDLLKAQSRLFKQLAAGLQVAFGIKNLLTDYQSYQRRARYVKGLRTLIEPIRQTARYASSYKVRKLAGGTVNQLPSEYIFFEQLNGNSMSRMGDRSRSMVRETSARLGKTWLKRAGFKEGTARSLAVEPVSKVVNAISELIQLSDAGPRLAEMVAAGKEDGFRPLKGGFWQNIATGAKVDSLPEMTVVKMASAATNATINFKLGGTLSKEADVLAPFLMATINSQRTNLEDIANLKHITAAGEKGDLARRFGFVIVATVTASALGYAIRKAADDEDEYKNADQDFLDKYWAIGGGFGIPKSRDEAIIANITEIVIDDLFGDVEPRKLQETIINDLTGRIPTGGGLFRGVVELLMNEDLYRNKPIETVSVQNRDAEFQYDDRTLPLSKAIGGVTGKLMNLSPMQLEHLLNSVTANKYKQVHKSFENMMEGHFEGGIPGARALYRPWQLHRPINDLYDKIDQLETSIANAEVDGSKGSDGYQDLKNERLRLRNYANLRSAINKDMYENPGKRDEYENLMVGLCREALNYETVDSTPSPLTLPVNSLPGNVPTMISDWAEKVAEPAILMQGVPQKVPKDQEGKKTLAEVRNEYRNQLDSKLDYLEEHSDDPVFKDRIAALAKSRNKDRSKRLDDAMTRVPAKGEMTSREYADDLKRHREQTKRIRRMTRPTLVPAG